MASTQSRQGERRQGQRRRPGRHTLVGLAVLAAAVLVWFAWSWFVGETTWPPELDSSPSAALFPSARGLTDDELVLLAELVGEIAERDPIVIELLDGKPWPEPDIRPVVWIGADGRSAVIGGTFELDLEGADYFGPWPSASCQGTKYRGTVLDARAIDIERISVSVDLNFERVTYLSIGPQPVPPPGSTLDEQDPTSVTFIGELPDAPWYTGRCKRSFGPN